ncbi:hypothetical protein [Endozoicomonas arenosclerae]|uniref:hypothetical protein n=1 Tax=Endozoicomonas arenosclerae TaxID=1633495 RepID=UPI0012946812|nr:hypothetical protein [Endozoicomonas arenosclerae]
MVTAGESQQFLTLSSEKRFEAVLQEQGSCDHCDISISSIKRNDSALWHQQGNATMAGAALESAFSGNMQYYFFQVSGKKTIKSPCSKSQMSYEYSKQLRDGKHQSFSGDTLVMLFLIFGTGLSLYAPKPGYFL